MKFLKYALLLTGFCFLGFKTMAQTGEYQLVWSEYNLALAANTRAKLTESQIEFKCFPAQSALGRFWANSTEQKFELFGNTNLKLAQGAITFGNDNRKKKLALWGGTSTGDDWYGLGMDFYKVRFQTGIGPTGIKGGFGFFVGNDTEVFTVRGSGKVGIGTTNPDKELTVNGEIHAKGLILDLTTPGPDYVFATDYKLRPLAEVEAYIQKNHHLPAVPSAKTMEAKGVKMLEMSMKLLEKVEELTLYTIAQQKEIAKLKAQVKQLQQK